MTCRHPLFALISALCLFYSASISAQTIPEYNQASSAYQSGDYLLAAQLWSNLASTGDANAQYALGIMHLKKEAPDASEKLAFSYFVAAAKQQHVAAIFNLGVAYWEGRGVSRQPAKALNWWEIAAQRQDAGAQYNLGLGYYLGVGRDQDDQKATFWIQQAADNGHPQAIALLSNAKGDDTPIADSSNTTPSPATQSTAAPTPDQIQPTTDEAVLRSIDKEQVAPPEIDVVTDKASDTSISKAKALPSVSSPTKRNSNALQTNRLTELRVAPGASSASLLSLSANTPVQLLQSAGDWSKVLVQEAFPVWVYETYLTDLGDGKGKIKGANVNIRPRPSTDNQSSPALGQLNEGDQVKIVLKRVPWVQIIPAHVFPAWIASEDIK